MKTHRICLNCGKKINIIKSILYNKCCSYKCDCIYEDKKIIKEREDWELWKKKKSNENIKEISLKELASGEQNKNNMKVDSMDDLEEFYDYCLTDEDDSQDYTY